MGWVCHNPIAEQHRQQTVGGWVIAAFIPDLTTTLGVRLRRPSGLRVQACGWGYATFSGFQVCESNHPPQKPDN